MIYNYLILTCFFLTNGILPSFKGGFPDTLYVGMESQIHSSLKGCDPEDVQIKINSGNIYKRDDSTYIFHPQIPEDEMKIKLYYKKLLCELKTVKVKKLADIEPSFEFENQGFIKKSDLQKSGHLQIKYPEDYPEDLKTTLVSFNFMAMEPGGISVYSATIRGDKLDANAMQTIGKLVKGSRLIINNVITQNKRAGMSVLNIHKQIVLLD